MEFWLPIGPSAVLRGQASGHPLVSGRVTGIAPLADGKTVYICTANGGVWKSVDADKTCTWIPTMEGFHSAQLGSPAPPGTSPERADSLACGAIAVAPGKGTNNNDLIYVGTGEGFVGYGRYFGVGPLVSDDGGTGWRTEQANPPLVGGAFWRLAIDPADAQHVFAATRNGLYERVQSGSDYVWNRVTLPTAAPGGAGPRPEQPCTGLAIARAQGGTATHAYVAYATVNAFVGGVYHWDSSQPAGSQWSFAGVFAGSGLNPPNLKIMVLAMQRDNPQVVYALVSNQQGHMAGVYRLDTGGGAGAAWVALANSPARLFGDNPAEKGQGEYDIALAVDPEDVNLIYLGGSVVLSGGVWSSALYRCHVTPAPSNTLTCDYIGARVHPDIHAIEVQPKGQQDARKKLWVGCDGGVFFTDNALGDVQVGGKPTPTAFASRNLGLSTLQVVRLGVHPTEDGVLFAGVQDNGTLRYTGEELWLHSGDGDGGAVLVNAADTGQRRLLRGYIRGQLQSTSDGGQSVDTWRSIQVPLSQWPVKDKEPVAFYPPIVALPPDPAHPDPDTANLLAFGSERVWISSTFGQRWASIPNDNRTTDSIDGSKITALAWASGTKLYAATEDGTVARYDRDPTKNPPKQWTKRIIYMPPATAPDPADPAIATTVPPQPITSIAVADAAGDSIYITVGGQIQAPYMGRARIWLGTAPLVSGAYTWKTASGPGNLADKAPASPEFRLLDIHHSVVIVDPLHRERLYAGADIGVWRSDDKGQHWYPYSFGIPEVAVVDLALHPDSKNAPPGGSGRVLWAGTHGRGVYEISADADPRNTPPPLLRYLVRDTHLDVGRRLSEEGGVDPTSGTGAKVAFGHSPDIRIDMPALNDTYSTLSDDITPAQFLQAIPDQMRAYRPPPPGVAKDNRVFVQVHQRGTALPLGAGVQVMLLLAHGTTPPALPAGVQNGTPVSSGDWKTVGTMTVNDVWPLMPRIAHFSLSSALLDGYADWCLLVLLHAAGVQDNELTTTETDVQKLCAQERLATWSTFSVVQTTRPTTTPVQGATAQLVQASGVGALAAQDVQAAPAGVVDA